MASSFVASQEETIKLSPCIEYSEQNTSAFVPQPPPPGTEGDKIIYELSAAANGPSFSDYLQYNNFTVDMYLTQDFTIQSHDAEGAISGHWIIGFYDGDSVQIKLYSLSGFDTCTGHISDEDLQRFAKVGLFVLPDTQSPFPRML